MISKKHLSFLGKLSAATLLVFTVACGPSLTLTDVDYAQPMESVVSPDQNGNVEDPRTGVSFNITALNVEERGEDASLPDHIRFIRSREGYYFVTAPGYSNVYVFESAERSLELYEIIEVSEAGLADPAFNQRSPQIQLLDGDTEYRLTKDGLAN